LLARNRALFDTGCLARFSAALGPAFDPRLRLLLRRSLRLCLLLLPWLGLPFGALFGSWGTVPAPAVLASATTMLRVRRRCGDRETPCKCKRENC